MVMLSRVADSLFWTGRYLERAEQMARQFEVSRDMLVDLSEPDPSGARAEWQATLTSLSLSDIPIERLVFDATEITSMISCVSQARENARQAREIIAKEMWERINQAYWSFLEAVREVPSETTLTKALTDTLGTVATWDGLADSAMYRGDAWVFLKLGKWIERLDRIANCILARLQQNAQTHSATKRNVVSVAMLRSLGALEPYRKVSPTKVEYRTVLSFLLFQPNLPRSLRYCALEAAAMVEQVARNTEPGARATRAFGRLASQLEHGDIDEVIASGPEDFLSGTLRQVALASGLLRNMCFLS